MNLKAEISLYFSQKNLNVFIKKTINISKKIIEVFQKQILQLIKSFRKFY